MLKVKARVKTAKSCHLGLGSMLKLQMSSECWVHTDKQFQNQHFFIYNQDYSLNDQTNKDKQTKKYILSVAGKKPKGGNNNNESKSYG